MREVESWSELKARIERIVPLEPQPLELGQRQFTWYRVANPESLLEAAVSDASRPAEEIDPFWAATWRAAIGLDRFLGSLVMADKRVLELGCGSGQAGTGAAARGAWVTMSDAVGLALQVAQLNAWPVRERIRFCQLRWDIDRLDEAPFPLVIGSDLVYDPQLFPRLSACARQHLAPGGRLVLSEPYRHTGDLFSAWIVDQGWRCRGHQVDLQDARTPIRIFECWLDGP